MEFLGVLLDPMGVIMAAGHTPFWCDNEIYVVFLLALAETSSKSTHMPTDQCCNSNGRS